MKKRWISLALAMLCCLGFAGCDKTGGGGGTVDQSQVESRMTSPFETTANISYKDIKLYCLLHQPLQPQWDELCLCQG